MSHTIKVIAGGLVLLGLFLVAGRLFNPGAPSVGMATAAGWFIPIWLICAAINLWVGVAKAGYSLREEALIFLLVFAVPAAVALLVGWRLAHG